MSNVQGIIPAGGKTLTDVYSTPLDLFEELDREFHFTVDVCALEENAKCQRHYSPLEDGLTQDWSFEVAFMNPPYSDCTAWMRKAYEAARDDAATVVCLVPARTDTAWWHEYAMKGEVRFLRGRLRFNGMKVNAPFPSAIVIFRSRTQ